MSPTDKKDIDPLADLDDDLGDDWESAFQSEDFMFSPDEEANDFFLFDENDSEEDIDDLTSIMEDAQQEVLKEEKETDQDTTAQVSDSSDGQTFPNTPLTILSHKASAGLSFLKSRPLSQRIIAITIPCLALLLLIGVFFLRSTSEELAQTEDQAVSIADLHIDPDKKPEPTVKAPAPPEEPQPARARTIRKQWDFPTFTIVSSTPNTDTLFVKVKLSLIAIIQEGTSLPEEKNVLVKDIIYQFYKNRSPQELRNFALARGEMIHKLHSWLQKEWPDSPINTVIFSKYQVIVAPQTS